MYCKSALNAMRIAVVAMLLVGWSWRAMAQTTLTWSDTTQSGDFFDANNWNPQQIPANGDSLVLVAGDYTATAQTTASYSALDLSIGAGATLSWQGPHRLALEYDGTHTNSGIMRFNNSNSTLYMWAPGPSVDFRTVYNEGVVEADSITLTIQGRRRNIDNTGGILRAVKGGTITWAMSGFTTTAGSFTIDDTATMINDGVNRGYTLSGVAVANEGHLEIVERTGGASGQIQRTRFNITNGGSLDNSGTILIENRKVDTRRGWAEINFSADSTFTNTGTITLHRVTEYVNAYARITTASATLNAGVINLIDIVEESIHPVDPGDFHHESEARFEVTGNNSFTQTGANAAVNLDGGRLIAGPVFINGGVLAGEGLITASSTTIGSSGTVTPGNSIGTLIFSGDLTIEGAYALDVDMVKGGAGRLGVGGELDIEGAILDITVVDDASDERVLLIASAGDGIVGQFGVVDVPVSYRYSLDLENGNTELWLRIYRPRGSLFLMR